MVVHRGRCPMNVFRQGICLVIYIWWEIRCFIETGLDDDHKPRPKIEQLCLRLFEWFLRSKVPPSVPSATMKLKELISFLEVDLIYLDNSLEEVSEQLVVMYHECLQGDFSSVEIILEANLGLDRHLVRPNVVKLCFAYLERILRDKLYSLPIDHQFATSGITKETLMRMHQECLQGNFSSVKILMEESLNQDKGMLERFGVAPPVAAVPVVSGKSGVVDYGLRGNWEREENYHQESREVREKIRVARQKEREKERRLEAMDAAMGKNSKISRDRDRDISEELDLGYASTWQETKFTCDGMLFNLDT
ncbi:SNW domain-containing protein 1 [Orobanche minor]